MCACRSRAGPTPYKAKPLLAGWNSIPVYCSAPASGHRHTTLVSFDPVNTYVYLPSCWVSSYVLSKRRAGRKEEVQQRGVPAPLSPSLSSQQPNAGFLAPAAGAALSGANVSVPATGCSGDITNHLSTVHPTPPNISFIHIY